MSTADPVPPPPQSKPDPVRARLLDEPLTIGVRKGSPTHRWLEAQETAAERPEAGGSA